MKQKNQKIGTFSRTSDRSGDVGEQKHGEEWKNFFKNDNTFLTSVTSSKDVHAMHITSKKQINEKIHADFSRTQRGIVCAGNPAHKNFQKEKPLRTCFFEKDCEARLIFLKIREIFESCGLFLPLLSILVIGRVKKIARQVKKVPRFAFFSC